MDFLTKLLISEPKLREATEAYLEMKGKSAGVKFTRAFLCLLRILLKGVGVKSAGPCVSEGQFT